MSHIRLVVLFVFICRWQLIVTAVEPGCEQCGCCVDKLCAPTSIQSHTINDYCTKGCPPGIGGNKCYNKCPGDCVTCEQTNFANCATCVIGQRLNSDKRCIDCPTTCTACTSNTECQECDGPYYNQGNITDCSLTCPGNCVCSSPVCSACQDGYFNVNDDCMSVCRETCIACNSYDWCTQCKHGFTGSRCQNCLPGLHGVKCNEECPVNCKGKICVHNTGECVACPDGYFGLFCDSRCSPRCLGNTCDANSGACLECEPSYSGDKCCTHNGHCLRCLSHTECQTCVKGFYSDTCNETCPTTCLNEHQELECDRSNGICLTCRDGFYGDYCNLTCNIHCLTRRCIKDNGHCTVGCIGEYEGPTCSEAADTALIDGVAAIGISSAVTLVMIIILASAFVLILKRRKRKYQQRQAPQISYLNTELQPVSADTHTEEHTQNDSSQYEDTTHQETGTDYDLIK